MYSSVIFVQANQEVFMAKEWVRYARNEDRVEANLHAKTSKALVAVD